MKTLLLAPFPPCSRFTGCILLEAMCRFLPRGSVASFSPSAFVPPDVRIADDLSDMPVVYATPPSDTPPRLASRFPVAASAKTAYNRGIGLRRLVHQAVAFGHSQRVDRVWCVLQGPVLCHLGLAVARRLGVPLYSQVWDYPEYWIKHEKFDSFSRRAMLNDYQDSVRSSSSCAAASREMAEEITAHHGTPAVPIIGSLDRSIAAVGPPPESSTDGEITIGMAGQLYAAGAWGVLLRALDSVDWRINGRDVRVKYMGYYSPLPPEFVALRSRRACVEYLGFRPLPEVVSILSGCTLNYVPFFSGEAFDTLTATSFPAKVAAYLAAGRPVFFHGPDFAPASRFIREHRAGVTCDSLEPSAVVEDLERLLSDPDGFRRTAANAHQAFIDHLTLESLRRHFVEFISAPARPVKGIA